MGYLLIAGMPGAGKSSFCRWLRTEHGYIFVETDHAEGDPAVQALLDGRPGPVGEAVTDLMARGPDVVLEWGFAPPQLGKVRQVIGGGFDHWWFGGEESAARRAFVDRGDVAEAAFDVQVASIRESWPRIEKVFRGRMLEVVADAPDGSYNHAPPESLWAMMTRLAAQVGEAAP